MAALTGWKLKRRKFFLWLHEDGQGHRHRRYHLACAAFFFAQASVLWFWLATILTVPMGLMFVYLALVEPSGGTTWDALFPPRYS